MPLTAASLQSLPAAVRRPDYDRSAVTPGIVHLGIGAFHRAHQAAYVDALLKVDPSWGIVGASLRSPDTADALNPQDGLYTLAVREDDRTDLSVTGSILEVIVAPQALERLLSVMADPRVRIVTLTVTEKGYCHDPATGRLDENHPGIRADLANPTAPTTAPGILVEALARRRAAGVQPFTVLSCDNLPANGRTVKRIVARFAELRDPDLGRYVDAEVAFPCSMVDRIVPATTDADRATVKAALGTDDAWPVMTEPFTQWVVEDDFPAGRPRFEDVGVEMVEDVEPFELMKLRMLNGSHSTLAYLGYLAGYETVADVMADEAFATLVRDLMTEEVMPTVDVPGIDLGAYRDALVRRFRNRGLKHRTWQIAMDGSQKLPQRLLGTIRARLAAGAAFDRLALGVAAWMAYVRGVDEKGQPIDVRDPLAARLRAIADGAGADPEALVNGFLAVADVFGTDLPADSRFRSAVTAALTRLLSAGSAATVAAVSRTSAA
ncbi:mannitol dehydrogenase family protein [Chthonobacter rhizosphaerae]|uniref:mannitol dehydrogenase family protein n=1 Tax=Chthonobacter rhizosphaerae TaxID=2735553 RepID=UPI0015EF5B96|nr:mannitol dehydrogenase family protein [Chthonobacter rhizosphaerae]